MSENLTEQADNGPDLSTTAGKIEDFYARREQTLAPAGQAPIDRQHERGKQTARERVEMLLDEGSFVEFDALARHRTTAFGMDKKRPLGDGLVSGYGTIDGRQFEQFFASDVPESLVFEDGLPAPEMEIEREIAQQLRQIFDLYASNSSIRTGRTAGSTGHCGASDRVSSG